ncbi:MAG: c-type cytochrome [Gammaproteobacteria bacterium]|nr:c-type cytochrome [Gammaproteobacteria bacterium]
MNLQKASSICRALSSKRPLVFAALVFISGIFFWGAFNTAMEATNTLGFCISCHEMKSTVYPEYKESIHYINSSGVQATCPDCHVPKEWTAKLIRKIKASRELYYWLTGEIDSKEKFASKRLNLAERVWHTMQENDSRECRNCHQFTAMKLASQARFAARIHADAIEQNNTCINCHQGIAHHLPERKSSTELAAKDDFDIEYAEEINETCAGCHGEYGEGSPDGEYPRLAGLDAKYLARQLQNFKTRERLNIPMLPYATERELPEADIKLISTYLSQLKLASKLPPLEEKKFDAFERLQQSQLVVNIARYPGNIRAGERLYQKECGGCHGRTGEGDASKQNPPLSGQYSQYLIRQIDSFRSSERLHDDPQDAKIFQDFGQSEINDILAFLSVQDDH